METDINFLEKYLIQLSSLSDSGSGNLVLLPDFELNKKIRLCMGD